MFEELIPPFKRYFSLPHADYAIMLSGPWGCGKTHFVRNHLFRESDAFDLLPVYFSLSGVEDGSEVIRGILLSHAFSRSEIGSIERITEINSKRDINARPSASTYDHLKQKENLQIEDYLGRQQSLEDCIIFLDDLDRIGSFKEVAKIVGTLVYELVEKRHARVVFIANLQVVEKKGSGFGRIREKYVRTIIPFRENAIALVQTLLRERYADDCAPRAHLNIECGAVQKMREGPSEPTYRRRLQTTPSCVG